MKQLLAKLFIILVIFCLATGASAKRVGPEAVEPVILEMIEYSAPPEYGAAKYLEARDTVSGKLLGKYKIYEIKFAPMVEKDVQNVFIKNLTMRDGKIIITNEANEVFIFDPTTKSVTKE